MSVTLTSKQKEALELINNNETSLLYGGARSGKTFVICMYLHCRAIAFKNTTHLLARRTFRDAKRSIWHETLMNVLRLTNCLNVPWIEFNHSELYIKYANGSRLYVDGLGNTNSDITRLDKILGLEFSSIFLNEASQMSWDVYQTLISRLNPPKGVDAKMIIDYNPPSKMHWGYQIFEERKLPRDLNSSSDETTALLPDDDYGVIHMNPYDNIENLGEQYIERLERGMGYKKRQRFLYGQYTDIDGAIWVPEWIRNISLADLPKLTDIAIGVDPGGSVEGDATGIVVVGTDLKHLYVLEDLTKQGRTAKEWIDVVYMLYKKYRESGSICRVVIEKNYGGNLVPLSITSNYPDIQIELEHAVKSKTERATPIATQYEFGRIVHAGNNLLHLENEMLSWTPNDTSNSPNRIDALVWACTYLFRRYGRVLGFENIT